MIFFLGFSISRTISLNRYIFLSIDFFQHGFVIWVGYACGKEIAQLGYATMVNQRRVVKAQPIEQH